MHSLFSFGHVTCVAQPGCLLGRLLDNSDLHNGGYTVARQTRGRRRTDNGRESALAPLIQMANQANDKNDKYLGEDVDATRMPGFRISPWPSEKNGRQEQSNTK